MIEVLNKQRKRPIDRKQIAALSRGVLDSIDRKSDYLTILLVRDPFMHELNLQYRGIDKPTDVLSFAYEENNSEENSEGIHLGDMVISVDTAERYAAELELTFDRELEHLIIHGTLHLAGFDHETDNGEMSKLEKRLRKKFCPWFSE